MIATQPAPTSKRAWRVMFGAVLRHPSLWLTALRLGIGVVPRGWWRRPPFLPWPDRAYLAFRIETQYGTGGTLHPDHVVAYLTWCREMRAIARESH